MRFEIKLGREIRGLRIRLYPDQHAEECLRVLESDSRYAWNWLVRMVGYDSRSDASQARQAFAMREGLVGPRPLAPCHDGMTPEQSKKAAQDHYEACGTWHRAVHEATKKYVGCQPRKLTELLAHFGFKYDYQMLQRVISWHYEDKNTVREIEPGSSLLQALVKNYFTKSKGQRCKKFRRARDSMPIQVRSGDCFSLGDFGGRGRKIDGEPPRNGFYNCRISINGLKIRGRLPGKPPEGRVLEGVSVTKEADGWWASIKQEVAIRMVPEAVPNSVIGIDVGLDNLVAMSEVRIVQRPNELQFHAMGPTHAETKPVRIQNPRGKAYIEQIAGRQALNKPVGRIQQRASRHLRHLIYNEVIKPLAVVETIKVEELNGRIGQMGSSKVSAMRLAVQLLQERYGARVRAVKPHYTSQECSQCGFRSKETWSYEHGRYGECPKCGHKEDRDSNAARNIAARPLISLAS